jgi:superfamily II DNA helicase RecQ
MEERLEEKIKKSLKEIFGIKEFREKQMEAIMNVLQQKDTFGKLKK